MGGKKHPAPWSIGGCFETAGILVFLDNSFIYPGIGCWLSPVYNTFPALGFLYSGTCVQEYNILRIDTGDGA